MLNIDEIIELRKLINDNFGEKLHYHDACGGQYFSLDKSNEEILDFIRVYVSKKGGNITISDNGINISIT